MPVLFRYWRFALSLPRYMILLIFIISSFIRLIINAPCYARYYRLSISHYATPRHAVFPPLFIYHCHYFHYSLYATFPPPFSLIWSCFSFDYYSSSGDAVDVGGDYYIHCTELFPLHYICSFNCISSAAFDYVDGDIFLFSTLGMLPDVARLSFLSAFTICASYAFFHIEHYSLPFIHIRLRELTYFYYYYYYLFIFHFSFFIRRLSCLLLHPLSSLLSLSFLIRLRLIPFIFSLVVFILHCYRYTETFFLLFSSRLFHYHTMTLYFQLLFSFSFIISFLISFIFFIYSFHLHYLPFIYYSDIHYSYIFHYIISLLYITEPFIFVFQVLIIRFSLFSFHYLSLYIHYAWYRRIIFRLD